MFKTYHFSIPVGNGKVFQSEEYKTIEECVQECKLKCKDLGVDYNQRDVMLFLTEDFGETYEECTEEGELA
jgi:hypothetical protein